MARELNNKFSWKTSTFMAKLSYHAYDGLTEFKKVFTKDWDSITFFDAGGTECYVLTCPKNYIVVFRGTEPTSWEDIKADINIHKSRREYQPNNSGTGSVGKVHSGFRHALNDIWDKLLDHYKNNNGNTKQLLVTGHSLGAALAVLYTDRINDSQSVCYTYGCPRPGNKDLISNMNFNCYRFRNNNDIVTRVPFEWLGFSHKGELKYFNVDGIVRHGFSRWYLFSQWLKGTYRTLMRDKTWDAFADHSMGEYYNLCKQQLIEENLDV